MKIIIIVLMMLYSPAMAGVVEYLDSSVTIIDQMRVNLNLAHTNVTATDSICLGFVYEGAMVVSTAIGGRLFFDTVVTTAFDNILAYDTLMVSIKDVEFFSRDSSRQVDWVEKNQWNKLEAITEDLSVVSTFPERLPTYYDWVIGYLFLHPTPGHSDDSILIIGLAKPDSMVADSEFVQDIMVTHRPAILYYATSMLALRMGMMEKQQAWEAKYDRYVAPLLIIKQKAEVE